MDEKIADIRNQRDKARQGGGSKRIDKSNFLLMRAMASNAAGVLLGILGN